MFSESGSGMQALVTLCFAVVLGLMVVPNVLPKEGIASETKASIVIVQATSTKASTPEQATSTPIYLGSPTPAAMSDVLYLLDPATKKIKSQSIPPGWRITALNDQVGTLEQRKDRLVFKSINGWEMMLRTPKGEPYSDVHILGGFDADHVALSAEQSGTVILEVNKTGEIKELYHPQEQVNVLGMSGGSVWLSTFQPGEGIELPPQGPSSLIRVDRTGQKTVLRDSKVIVGMLAWDAKTFAYARDSGELVVQADSQQQLDQAKPLVWIDKTHLLYSRGSLVYQIDTTSGVSDQMGSVPTAPTVGKKQPEETVVQ